MRRFDMTVSYSTLDTQPRPHRVITARRPSLMRFGDMPSSLSDGDAARFSVPLGLEQETAEPVKRELVPHALGERFGVTFRATNQL